VDPSFRGRDAAHRVIGFTRADGRIAALAAWGQNREIHGNLDAYLLEMTLRPQTQHFFARESS
jgi:hypothetical protein